MNVSKIEFDYDGVFTGDYSGTFKTIEVQDGTEVWARQLKTSTKSSTESTLYTIQSTGVSLKCYYDHTSFGKYYFYGTKENNSELFTKINVDELFFPDHEIETSVNYPIFAQGIPERTESHSEEEVLIKSFNYANGDTVEYEDYYTLTTTPVPRTGRDKFLPTDYAELRVDKLCQGNLYSTGHSIADGSFTQKDESTLTLNAMGWMGLKIEHQMSSIPRAKRNMTGMVVIYDNSTNTWSFSYYSGTCFWTSDGSIKQYVNSDMYLTASVSE